jgi:hypothetical protein
MAGGDGAGDGGRLDTWNDGTSCPRPVAQANTVLSITKKSTQYSLKHTYFRTDRTRTRTGRLGFFSSLSLTKDYWAVAVARMMDRVTAGVGQGSRK